MRGVRLVLLVSLILLPVAQAAGAGGTLHATGAALSGSVELAAASGHYRSGGGAADLTLEAATLAVTRVGERVVTESSGLLPTSQLSSQAIDERREFSSATLTIDGAGDLGFAVAGPVTGLADAAALRAVSVAYVASTRPADVAVGCAAPDCIEAAGAYEVLAPGSTFTFTGDLRLIAFGPTVVVTTSQGPTTFASGDHATTDAGPVAQRERAFVVIDARGVSGTLVSIDGGAWFLPAPDARAQLVQLDDASGAIDVGLSSYRANGESAVLGGAMQLAFSNVASGGRPVVGADGSIAPRYADGFTTTLSGDVASINLRARPVFADSPATAAGLAAALAALLAVGAYLWPQIQYHATAAALPLYSRLKQPEILVNEVRNHIYEIVRENPGISAREIHRRSEQSWGTVVYHLRQLERHHLVVSRSVGRTRNYYENHGKYRGMEVQLACLQSARARQLARIVLEAPGITQEDLVARSALPQPTTSYYVRKLKAATLIEERREGRYARYHPHADLARFLQLAEKTPVQPDVGFGAAGVDA